MLCDARLHWVSIIKVNIMERQQAINIMEIVKIKLPDLASEISEAIDVLSTPNWINYNDEPPIRDGTYLFLIHDKDKKYGCLRVDIAPFKDNKYQGAWHLKVYVGLAEILGYIPIPNYDFTRELKYGKEMENRTDGASVKIDC